jgi:hypothetical protein
MAIFGRLTPPTLPPNPTDLRSLDYLLCFGYFLFGSFAELRKVTISFVIFLI